MVVISFMGLAHTWILGQHIHPLEHSLYWSQLSLTHFTSLHLILNITAFTYLQEILLHTVESMLYCRKTQLLVQHCQIGWRNSLNDFMCPSRGASNWILEIKTERVANMHPMFAVMVSITLLESLQSIIWSPFLLFKNPGWVFWNLVDPTGCLVTGPLLFSIKSPTTWVLSVTSHPNRQILCPLRICFWSKTCLQLSWHAGHAHKDSGLISKMPNNEIAV